MSTPTTELAYSYEYALDVNLGTHASPTWQQIRFSSAINPQVSDVSKDGATYDDDGAPHPIKTSESWTLSATVQAHRLQDGSGLFLPEVEALLAAAGPEATGNAATKEFRWYDDPVGQEPNPNEAYQGVGTVKMERLATGNDDIAGWNLTVTGQGRRTRIANPSTATSGAAPAISSVLPSGAAAGAMVTIAGTGFTGVTGAAGVKFGGTNAAAYVVASATKIYATLPAGSAGSAAVIVTHPTNGASASFAYTRA